MVRTRTGRGAMGMALGLLTVVLTLPDAAHAQADAHPRALLEPATEIAVYTTDELIRRALHDNPTLESLYDEWSAALLHADSVRSAWPQPRLSYTAYVLAVETRQGPQRHTVSLSQAFPWTRALRAQADARVAAAAVIAARFDAAALEAVYSVRRAVIALARVDAMRGVLQEQRDIYADVQHHFAAILPTGAAEHGDVLRAALMVELLDDRLATVHASRGVALADLRAVARLPTEAFEVASADWSADILAAAALPSAEQLTQAAVDLHPEFARLAAEADTRLAEAAATETRALPMPSVSVGWASVGQYETPLPGTGAGGRDVLSVGFSVPLPLARRQYVAAADAARTQADASAHAADALVWAVQADIEATLAHIEDERRRLQHYAEALLPIARDAAEHYAILIGHGQSNHTNYLLAIEQQLRLEEAVIAARFDLAEQLARLDFLTAGMISLGGAERPIIDQMPVESGAI